MKLYRNPWAWPGGNRQYIAYYATYSALSRWTSPVGGGILRHKYIYNHARTSTQPQTPGPPGFWHLQPAPRPGAPSLVPKLGVFRSPRPAPAQVRELAGPAAGTVLAGASRQRVWAVPA